MKPFLKQISGVSRNFMRYKKLWYKFYHVERERGMETKKHGLNRSAIYSESIIIKPLFVLHSG